MVSFPTDRSPPLWHRVKQQRNTVEMLKRTGHECPDAERYLRQLEIQLRVEQQKHTQGNKPDATVRMRQA
jgi:hypothetical protein